MSDARRLSYLDCDITIGEGNNTSYPITLRSLAGEADAVMTFPFSTLELENRLQTLQIALLRSGGRRRKTLSPEAQAVVDFGRKLFDALFIDNVRSLYVVSQERAEREGKGCGCAYVLLRLSLLRCHGSSCTIRTVMIMSCCRVIRQSYAIWKLQVLSMLFRFPRRFAFLA